ncbi:MAG: chromosomal replication initiator protein DnaA [Oscillospiraceae bacterium]|nr:chromosomal replication initiator protein DnaA [Oscillospiraceae bacterium]
MNSYSDVWKLVLERLRTKLSETTVNTWFDEVDVVTMEDSAFVLHCGNTFKRDIIETRFAKEIKSSLKDIFTADLEVKILDDDQLSAYHGVRPDRPDDPQGSDGFTFETFVIGPQNKLAYAAARAVAESPAAGKKQRNPLLIYGDSGLGKTHLLYAIYNLHRKLFPEQKIVYIKGDDFINDYVALVRTQRGEELRAKYRDANLLLVDDIQFLSNTDHAQVEFFHTFNALHEVGNQIVLTSDRPPQEMTMLHDRLRSRFMGGLMVDVKQPDYETRLAIIKNRAAFLGLNLSERNSIYIAENVTSNVRQIEGALNKIAAFRDLEVTDDMDEEAISRAIEDMLKRDNDFIPSPAVIIRQVCKYYGVDEDTVRGKNQGRDATNARQVSMYLIRRMTPLSMEDIGKEFGDRDHSTVHYSLQKVEKQMRTDTAFAETVKSLTTNINARQ